MADLGIAGISRMFKAGRPFASADCRYFARGQFLHRLGHYGYSPFAEFGIERQRQHLVRGRFGAGK
jgi:hypothetical protein